jgi:hypothetical protein
MTVYNINTMEEITRANSRAKTQGIICDAAVPVNATTDYDWAFPQERWMTGGILMGCGDWGSNVTLQVVDKDNVLGYGSGVVIDEFVSTFYILDTAQVQISKEFNYPALVPAGLYIRLKFHNSSLTNTGKVILNIFSHVPKI